MTTTIVVVVIVLLVLAAVAYFFIRDQRRRQLHQAERHLSQVARQRDALEIRDLNDVQRAAYREQWQAVQARFVDEPAAAVDGAQTLVDDVLRTRGYPVDDFGTQAELVATDHPDVVQEYREAHQAHERHRRTGQTGTEDLRQAFVHYRVLFDSLTGQDERPATSGSDGSGSR